ncbi:RNA-binding S4 domain-containing protein [Pseudogracilibacillus auburnensis]|uniref:RQC P-site tRNA stabilizing factor n=1 Tax=Pseudogracilibacillus auburnensis TaxID=1494959 RepID=A0A2V3VI88_9BACI|nr:RNA-binding S4 domain-containing protein [Pseudogracilibacillus auburnensis]MBO1004449.1 RNA-binding S4 domain-containing protein [Pseudogracilibacillus auburnensis]PXW81556.1 ribosomal 50S subunit-recycling heat shock protein [Pseudogracilibacillus auburnensis]
MRLDKFLKVSRIIKRRPLAKQVAEQNRIKVNDVVAKPSINVEVGDEITITFGQTILTVKVLNLKDHVKKEEATSLYEVVKEEKINQDE